MNTCIHEDYQPFGDTSYEFVKQCIAFTFPEQDSECDASATQKMRANIFKMKNLLQTMETKIQTYEHSMRIEQSLCNLQTHSEGQGTARELH